MDFNLKQWRNQQHDESENEHQHSAKIPKLHDPQYQMKPEMASETVLPLFLPHHHHHQLQPNKISMTQMSPNPFTDGLSTQSPTSSRFPKTGGSGYFSVAQWQELELQALILRYMIVGAAVPPELLLPIKKSIALLNAPHLHYYPPTAAMFQTGYWGRAAMDPEPGRCRRTDGKKWRCSRDVVVGQKYCERHVHRGRNRSRKPVEVPTQVAGKVAGAGAVVLSGDPNYNGSGSGGSVDLMCLSRSLGDTKRENKRIFEPHDGAKSDGHVLSLFFDDWPRPLQEPDNVVSSVNPATSLSIAMAGNPSSDVSLKLSTGIVLDRPSQEEIGAHSGQGLVPMGGPLAEALRSAHSNSSPTSVLHQLPRG